MFNGGLGRPAVRTERERIFILMCMYRHMNGKKTYIYEIVYVLACAHVFVTMHNIMMFDFFYNCYLISFYNSR